MGDINKPLDFGLRPILALTAEIASLLGIIGFILGVWLNISVFKHWNLQFLMVATPADVVMSGLQIFQYLVFGIVFAIFMLAFMLMASKISFFSEPMMIIVWTFIGALLLVAGTAIAIMFPASMAQYFPPDFEFACVGIGLATIHMFRRMRQANPSLESYGTWQLRTLWIGTACMILLGIRHTADDVAKIGFYSFGQNPTLIDPTLPGCAAPKLYWSGERSIVVQCTSGEMRVMHGAQDVVVRLSERSANPPRQ
ncbi:hypothetical protein [Sphingobium yanoikuyae]|uniref:hypothetical protein n=1 Tax=Sphingobium yanoikuyae TaxID=13690 RepID=UPI0008475043|nr:hypothetical protein [Sphingobium yanoikuyae]